jgi:hypothetical protein
MKQIHKPELRVQGIVPEHDMFDDMFGTICTITICFTICLFISPDLDGQRAPKMMMKQGIYEK